MRYALYGSFDKITYENPGTIYLHRRNRKSSDDLEDKIYVRTYRRRYLQPRNSRLIGKST
jgi:hypothetical protein